MWIWTALRRQLANSCARRRRKASARTFSKDQIAAIEQLEQRVVLTVVSGADQYFLELMNRARANPAAEATRQGIGNINEGITTNPLPAGARQPLALNDNLQASIAGHVQDEINHQYIGHTGSDGSNPITRIAAAGYGPASTLGENLSLDPIASTVEQSVNVAFHGLFADLTVPGRDHRINILDGNFKEVGSALGIANYQGEAAIYTGQDFGTRHTTAFLTGVAYNDSVSANNFYDIGEGLGGISVDVKDASGNVTHTTANGAGGYQMALPAGTYTVTFSGTGISVPITKTFTIDSLNVKVDLNTRVDKSTGGPPALTGTNPMSYLELSAAVPIDSAIVISDVGRTTLASAKVTITNYVAGQDVLGFVRNADLMGNITVSSNTAGVLTLTSAGATATLAQWQTALRAVTYSNTSNGPTSTTRNVTFLVDDGQTVNHFSNALPTTVGITVINNPPVGTPGTVTTLEDKPYVFKVTDFGFTDPIDTPSNLFSGVIISSVPVIGSLSDNGVTLSAGTIVPVADISAGKLKYSPALNGNGTAYASFTFQVQDNGGTASGGINTDVTARSMTIAVTSVNDPPVATSGTITAFEDTPYVFKTSDFGFTDRADTPANSLLAVTIKTLPLQGRLTDQGIPVTAGMRLTAADIARGNFKFASPLNVKGAQYASFLFQVQDNGGTANGGVDTDLTYKSLMINVAPVNDPPSGVSKIVATPEDIPYVVRGADFGFDDPIDTPANTFLAVKIDSLPLAGTLTDNGRPFSAGTVIPASDAFAGKLIFTPAANASGQPYGSFTFQVQDNGGTANGGIDTDPTARSFTINVAPVNDAPIARPATVTTLEDTPYVFKLADFGFSDPNDSPANTLLNVKMTTVPSRGSLLDNGVTLTAGALVSAREIAAGYLKFVPLANGNATPYIGFTFQVQDNGGTANSGHDTDLTPRAMTINVTSVNDAPQGKSNTVTTLEDAPFVFIYANFGYSDPNDFPISLMKSVRITALPRSGTLADNGVPVQSGLSIPVADITGGKLTYKPAANANGIGYGSFTFQVQDNGGTANGGADTDLTPRVMTINVTPVNDAPVGINATVTALEDVPYAFKSTDFSFMDPNDSPANTLLAVKITTVPSRGTLSDNGQTLTAGAFVSAADIANGKFTFLSALNGNGTPYIGFTFQVEDTGGTANLGRDLDYTARVVTINVTPVNDPPVGTAHTVQMQQNTTYVFKYSDFGYTDPNDSPINVLLYVKITTLPGQGTLTDGGDRVTAGQLISVADITNGYLKFTPSVNGFGAPYASFSFQLQDNGGTVNGGVDLDPTPRLMTIFVNKPIT